MSKLISSSNNIIAVGLLSGGLDSALACKIIKDMGFDVHAVYLDMPWGCGKADRARRIAEALGLTFKVIPLADDYLDLLRHPRHGFGSAHNPCVDCHTYMVRKAADYMKEVGGNFIFTGEVIGQRPMSQRKMCLNWVEEDAGMKGRVLRPLCAKRLEPTIPELEGVVDREKMLDFEGRSRTAQFALAAELKLEGFAAPSGGCLLTEKVFGARVKDVLQRGCSSIQETTLLAFGRYFRIGDHAFVMLGRDERENEALIRYALPGDIIFRTYDFPSPTVVLRGKGVTQQDMELSAGLLQFFSKLRNDEPLSIPFWPAGSPEDIRTVTPVSVPDEAFIKTIWM